jgi:hypothetical protein
VCVGLTGGVPVAAQGEAPVPGAAAAFDSADELLTALETADADITTFSSRINYRKFFAIQSDEQERRGTLYFKTDHPEDGTPPKRRFAVTFNELIVAGRREATEQHYAFDGQWVVEKTPSDRQFTKRQVVPPGESFDPLKIGEGPFPVPVGQRKADIVERFETAIAPTAEGLDDPSLASFAAFNGLVQLSLTPKPGTPEASDFESIRIWYEPAGRMLPRIAKTVNPVGDESLVVLLEPVVNEPIDDAIFDTAVPPDEEGWNVNITEYRRPASD